MVEAAVELRELLGEAQAVLEEGRPDEAATLARHVLRHHPDAITALRLLGEANLESGRAAEARRCFERVLTLEPLNALARVGLGVIAEDRGDDEGAIAQFRRAWDIEPALQQLRGELVRLYRKRYGAGGRLRLTRLGLANLHARNEDLLRAIAGFRALLAEDAPAVPRALVALGLAAALWRREDNTAAEELCRELLAAAPQTARALLILAAIVGDGDAGLTGEAGEFLHAARALDPDAALARDLVALRPSATLSAFVDERLSVPPFDPSTPTAALDVEERSPGPTTAAEVAPGSVAPTRWEDIAGGWDTLAAGAVTGPAAPDALAGEASFAIDERSLDVFGEAGVEEEAGGDTLFTPLERGLAGEIDDAGGAVALAASPTSAIEGPSPAWHGGEIDDELRPTPGELSAVERLTANWDNIDDELAAARPDAVGDFGDSALLAALGDADLDVAPFDIDGASAPDAPAPAFDPSSFELPPLDDEDDELEGLEAFGLEPDELGDDLVPFRVEENISVAGRSFADLIDVGASGAEAPVWEDAPEESGDVPTPEPRMVRPISIFATRELDSLRESEPGGSAPPVAAADMPVGGEPDGLDRLFDRLRERKHDRVQAGELTVNRRLQPGGPLQTPELPSAGPLPAAPSPRFEGAGALDTREPSSLWGHEGLAGGGGFQPLASFGPASNEDVAADVSEPSFAEPIGGDDAAKPEAAPEGATLAEEVPHTDDGVWAMTTGDDPPDLSAASAGEDGWLGAAPADAPAASFGAAGSDVVTTLWDEAGSAAPAGGVGWDSLVSTGVAPESLPVPAAELASLPLVAPDDDLWDPRPSGAAFAPPPPAVAPTAPDLVAPTPVDDDAAVRGGEGRLAALEALVAANPANAFARLTLAVAYAGEQPEQSLNEYRRLIKESEELLPEVVERLREMIADGVGGGRAHRVLGDAYMKLGQFDLAMAEFQRALASHSLKR